MNLRKMNMFQITKNQRRASSSQKTNSLTDEKTNKNDYNGKLAKRDSPYDASDFFESVTNLVEDPLKTKLEQTKS